MTIKDFIPYIGKKVKIVNPLDNNKFYEEILDGLCISREILFISSKDCGKVVEMPLKYKNGIEAVLLLDRYDEKNKDGEEAAYLRRCV